MSVCSWFVQSKENNNYDGITWNLISFGGQITHYIILSRKIINIIRGGGGLRALGGVIFIWARRIFYVLI